MGRQREGAGRQRDGVAVDPGLSVVFPSFAFSFFVVFDHSFYLYTVSLSLFIAVKHIWR